MPSRRFRPIYTNIGSVKPLGKTRLVKKQPVRPWAPFRIRSYAMKKLGEKPPELIIHRRPSGRINVGMDPREAVAVPKTQVRGTLPERIFYKKLLVRRYSPWADFDFQSSLDGGRMEVGGIVADFMFRSWRLIIRVQGPTHKTEAGAKKDKAEAQYLAQLGWTVYDLDENICYDINLLEQWCRRYLDVRVSTGGRMPLVGLPTSGSALFLTTGELNFAWTAQEMQRFNSLADAVVNLQNDLERLQAGKVVTVGGLSDIDTSLGLVQAGEFRVGNGKTPGRGFTGVRIGYPPFAYEGQLWHIAGLNDDVLQFGLSALDGAAYAAGGLVVINENGIGIEVGDAVGNRLRWFDPSDGNDQSWLYTTTLGTANKILTYFRIGSDNASLAKEEGTLSIWVHNTTSTGTLEGVVLNIQGRRPSTSQKYIDYYHYNFDTTVSRSFWAQYVTEGAVFNEDGYDWDFRIEGDTDPNCFFVDAGLDLVNVNKAACHNYWDFEDKTAPGTPGSGYGRLYVTGDKIYFKNDSGTAFDLAAGGMPVFDADFSTTSWTNTTSWNTVITITIPSGTLAANFGLYCINQFYFVNNTGSTYNILWRVYDGTSYYPNSTGYTDGVGSSANDRPYSIPFTIQSDGSSYLCQFQNVPGQADQCLTFSIASDPDTTGITLYLQIQLSFASTSFHFNHRSHIIFGPFE